MTDTDPAKTAAKAEGSPPELWRTAGFLLISVGLAARAAAELLKESPSWAVVLLAISVANITLGLTETVRWVRRVHKRRRGALL